MTVEGQLSELLSSWGFYVGALTVLVGFVWKSFTIIELGYRIKLLKLQIKQARRALAKSMKNGNDKNKPK